ncbi:MAG: hypothetical protein Q7J76_09105 [Candidatus Brocadiaceae bacterium]|nr:hypothetical protein [Candidatus Brocadiaceae bacterium]
MNGLDFCKKAYGLFEETRRSPNGIERLRLIKGRPEKKVIEELLPIARYIQARYSHCRQIKVRWIDGKQNYDARLLFAGILVEKRLAPKRQYVEVTTAVHENDHISRRLMNEQGHTFGVKGVQKDPHTGKYVSLPHVYTNYEAQEDLAQKILERIKAKNKKEYPRRTTLIIQCFLDTLFWENEWEYAIKMVKSSGVEHRFHEIFLFDANHHYSATLYGTGRKRKKMP